MTKPINEYTIDELSKKIEAIKAERERTAKALKKYEEELERRKQEVPLGVPTGGEYCVLADGQVKYTWHQGSMEQKIMMEAFNLFPSFESGQKHAEMLKDWRKDGLLANAKGEPIDIKVLCPLLKKGKVAFCPISRRWFWTNEIPQLMNETWGILGDYSWIGGFNLKPAENWRESLMECGLCTC